MLEGFTESKPIFNFKKRQLKEKLDGQIDVQSDGLTALVSIEDIRDGQCRWPVETMNWCGRPVDGNHVYCADHHGRSLNKQPRREVEE